jgi:hypothetical protein
MVYVAEGSPSRSSGCPKQCQIPGGGMGVMLIHLSEVEAVIVNGLGGIYGISWWCLARINFRGPSYFVSIIC